MSKVKTIFTGLLLSMVAFFSVVPVFSPVSAQTNGNSLVCTIFPFLKSINFFGINTLCGTQPLDSDSAFRDVLNLVQTLAGLIFVVIIIIAIYIIIKAAIKYIRSEGDESKIQEAQKAIKSVFIGLIALFVGIIGLVLILVIFNALAAVNTGTPDQIQECLNNGGVLVNGVCDTSGQ